MGALVAVPLWRRKIITLADLLRRRFGTQVERLAVLLMVPTSLLWAAAQIRAFGQVLGAASALEIDTTITIAALVVLAYTTAGGLLADAITDFVQGSVLILGLVVVVATMAWNGDLTLLSEVPAERLTFRSAAEPWFVTLEHWAVPVLGSVVAQELVARVVAARSPRVARGATLGAAGLYFCVGVIPVLAGLIAAQRGAVVGEPEQVLVLEAARHLPAILHVVFTGALVSAILSTVDSALLVSGSLVAHNLFGDRLAIRSPRSRLRANRVAVVLLGLVAYAMALAADGVYALVEEASAFGTAGLFVTVVAALTLPRFGGGLAAVGALVTGVVVYALGAHVLAWRTPYLASLIASAAVYGVLGAAGQRVRGPRSA